MFLLERQLNSEMMLEAKGPSVNKITFDYVWNQH